MLLVMILSWSKDYGIRALMFTSSSGLFESTIARARFLAEDPYGRKHVWFGSGGPNNPDIRRRTLRQVSEILEKHDVSSILLDGIRFASMGNGLEAFATCFCENCRNKAEKYGYPFEEMKQSVKKMLNAFYDFK
ncbi:MAG: hypothetical protein QXY99_06020, partial [Thermoproteota archaeon]